MLIKIIFLVKEYCKIDVVNFLPFWTHRSKRRMLHPTFFTSVPINMYRIAKKCIYVIIHILLHKSRNQLLRKNCYLNRTGRTWEGGVLLAIQNIIRCTLIDTTISWILISWILSATLIWIFFVFLVYYLLTHIALDNLRTFYQYLSKTEKNIRNILRIFL